MPILPECSYRVDAGVTRSYVCRHTAVRARDNTVTDDVCLSCGLRTSPCHRPREVKGTPLPTAPPDPAGTRALLPGRFAVLTCYFNPCGYAAFRRNYHLFAAGLRAQGVPLYTIELAFGDEPFFLRAGETVRQLRTTDVLWHKERLLNLLLPTLPAEFDKVAWADADLIFTNPHWAAQTAQLLEDYPVVQPFERTIQLLQDGRLGGTRTGVAYDAARKAEHVQDFGKSHPGFAWAARRDLIEKHKLFDADIVGGGDAFMVFAMYGWWEIAFYVKRYPKSLIDAFRAWGLPFWADVRGRVGHAPGQVLHMWHGSRKNRQYNERVDWLRQHDFDPTADIAPGPEGLWRWASDKAGLHEQLRRYFSERLDDG